MTDLFSVAPIHRSLTQIDPILFCRNVPTLSIRVPANQTLTYRNQFQSDLLKQSRLSNTVSDPDRPDCRLLICNTDDKCICFVVHHATEVSFRPARLSANVRHIVERDALEIVPYNVHLSYSHWTADQILQSVLPEELVDDSPTSFATIGHLAHLNLRDEYLPYKKLIGQIILDKNANIRTVVNKLDTINNEFRFFDMEILAGENNTIAELTEQDCRFRFDFAKVYWNSRLSTEHRRLVDLFQPNQVVVDAFAGVGPFAVPAARKGCAVLASDLNPNSADALRDNIVLNKLGERCRSWNMDATVFIAAAVKEAWTNPFAPYEKRKKLRRSAREAAAPTNAGPPAPQLVSHFVMNLPGTAIEFLGCFRGLYSPMLDTPGFRKAAESAATPTVHCYCFSKAAEGEAEHDVYERASESLSAPIHKVSTNVECTFVRSVAPNKDMYRLSFRPNLEFLFA